MRKTVRKILPVFLLLLGSASMARTAADFLTECEVPGVQGKALCGQYEVFENRETMAGRKIPLKVVVLPATGETKQPDPIFYFFGGPGESATANAAGAAAEAGRLREDHDLVLIDQRGTGGSNNLQVDLFNPADLQSMLGSFMPVETVEKARQELKTKADLTLYTTDPAVDDFDEVREALGYDRIDIVGGSYGTRVCLVYLRRHPEHVRSAVMMGVAPTGDRMPLYFPGRAQRALDGVLNECLADTACKAAFPNIKTESKQVFAKLNKGPVDVEIMHPETGDRVKVKLSGNLGAEAIRYLLYQAGTSGMIPLALHSAAGGDYQMMAEMAIFGRKAIVGGLGMGLYLSVTCAEDLPWIKPGEGESAAKGSFLGDYRWVEQREACNHWPRGKVNRSYLQPVRSDVPVLMVTGMWDPATPPSSAEEAAKYLPNSLSVVVPHGGHGQAGLMNGDCVDRIVEQFIETGNAHGVDTSCLAGIRRTGFAVKPLPVRMVSLTPEELQKAAGRYEHQQVPFDLTVEVSGTKLLVASPDGFKMLLVPVSPTRFRVVGIPGSFVDFTEEGEEVTGMSLSMGGGAPEKFIKQ
jgi:pimeloyl-ACP methyl ester carboxylesterase